MIHRKDLENTGIQSPEPVKTDMLKSLRFKNFPGLYGELMGEIIGIIPGTEYCLVMLYEEEITDSPTRYCIIRIDELANRILYGQE